MENGQSKKSRHVAHVCRQPGHSSHSDGFQLGQTVCDCFIIVYMNQLRSFVVLFGIVLLVLVGMLTLVRRRPAETTAMLVWQPEDYGMNSLVEVQLAISKVNVLVTQPESSQFRVWETLPGLHDGWLYFRGWIDGSNHIFRVQPWRGIWQQITFGSGFDEFEGWSADNEWLLFSSGQGRQRDLYRIRRDGSSLQNLTEHLPAAFEDVENWSPDREWLVISVHPQDAEGSDLYLMRGDGSEWRNVTKYPAYYYRVLGWSPQSDWLLVDLWQPNNERLFRAPVDGSGLQALAPIPGRLYGNASWSPDGQWLLFSGVYFGNREIYLAHADGTNWHNLTHHAGYDNPIGWSDDGQWIVFESERDGDSGIYRMRADGSQVQSLHQQVGDDVFVGWGPEHSTIMVGSPHVIAGPVEDIYTYAGITLIEIDSKEQRRWLDEPGHYYGQMTWSPDRTWLAFDVYGWRSELSNLVAMRLRDGKQVDIKTDGYTEKFAAWLPPVDMSWHRNELVAAGVILVITLALKACSPAWDSVLNTGLIQILRG